ncbi:MAG TPA: glycine--tRNA ligase [candidate division Zixibacteria bacterium]|nr:glycine--tRNA ligase [candidate division Zixibacteria bacterium]
MAENTVMEKLSSLAKRRGFIFQSSEIYGGLNACWDYGPMGVELKRKIKEFWWRSMTLLRDDIEGLDAAILMHPKVWETSGHVANFTDPMVDCKRCKGRFRADEAVSGRCLKCGGELSPARQFNLMFKTFMGPVEEGAAVVYLRPETAQGIYVNFLNVMGPSRQKVPFGIAQIGKAFRNEISPGNFIFRMREFEQMEMQFFIHPKEDEKWFEFWRQERMKWYHQLGIRKEKLRFHQHGPEELAHYAKGAFDVQYEFPFGWQELEGIHNRTDFDLSRHSQATGKELSYFDEATKERFIPYIIETSAGCDRTLLTVLIDGYYEEEVKGETRSVLRIAPHIAPFKAAIFPLVNRDGMPEVATKIYNDLRKKFKIFYDDKGAVGRRYRRMDEVGTPFCITVDSQTLQDETVTLRDRDTMQQTRHKISELEGILQKKVEI